MVNSGFVYFAMLKAHTLEFGEIAQWVKVKGTWIQFRQPEFYLSEPTR